MATYIAFLRAVNVGGRHRVAMADLRSLLEAAGFTEVQTYIQSGNVRVDSRARSSAAVEAKLEKVMGDALGFDVATIVRRPGELAAMVESPPASPLGREAKHYVAFLRSAPTAAIARQLDGWDVEGERLTLTGRDLHLWLTKPSHEAKATNTRIEKMAGCAATSRGWPVVTTLAARWT